MGGGICDGAEDSVGDHGGEEGSFCIGGVEFLDQEGHGGYFEEGDDEVEEGLSEVIWRWLVGCLCVT